MNIQNTAKIYFQVHKLTYWFPLTDFSKQIDKHDITKFFHNQHRYCFVLHNSVFWFNELVDWRNNLCSCLKINSIHFLMRFIMAKLIQQISNNLTVYLYFTPVFLRYYEIHQYDYFSIVYLIDRREYFNKKLYNNFWVIDTLFCNMTLQNKVWHASIKQLRQHAIPDAQKIIQTFHKKCNIAFTYVSTHACNILSVLRTAFEFKVIETSLVSLKVSSNWAVL